MSAKLIRHIGRIKSTGAKCVVVFRKLPADPASGIAEDREFALVVETGAIPDAFHDNMIDVVNSPEAQQTHNLYEVFARRLFLDGTQMLATLHQRGWLRKMAVDNVVLYPLPSVPLGLREANDSIDAITHDVPLPRKEDGTVALPPEELASTARGLLAQAELLELDAAAKRLEAYTLDPSLRPIGRPKTSDVEKEKAKERENAKRRDLYRRSKNKKEAAAGAVVEAAIVDPATMSKVNARVKKKSEPVQ